jgi:hypothetical protein
LLLLWRPLLMLLPLLLLLLLQVLALLLLLLLWLLLLLHVLALLLLLRLLRLLLLLVPLQQPRLLLLHAKAAIYDSQTISLFRQLASPPRVDSRHSPLQGRRQLAGLFASAGTART